MKLLSPGRLWVLAAIAASLAATLPVQAALIGGTVHFILDVNGCYE